MHKCPGRFQSADPSEENNAKSTETPLAVVASAAFLRALYLSCFALLWMRLIACG
jgi:hypothetical protein